MKELITLDFLIPTTILYTHFNFIKPCIISIFLIITGSTYTIQPALSGNRLTQKSKEKHFNDFYNRSVYTFLLIASRYIFNFLLKQLNNYTKN